MEIAAGNSRNILPDTPGIGVSAGDLEDFIANKADLKLGFKLGLVKILYPNGGVSFDPVTDRLISIQARRLQALARLPAPMGQSGLGYREGSSRAQSRTSSCKPTSYRDGQSPASAARSRQSAADPVADATPSGLLTLEGAQVATFGYKRSPKPAYSHKPRPVPTPIKPPRASRDGKSIARHRPSLVPCQLLHCA